MKEGVVKFVLRRVVQPEAASSLWGIRHANDLRPFQKCELDRKDEMKGRATQGVGGR